MGQPPPGPSPSGHGPFGDKAFKGTLVLCLVMAAVGILMIGRGNDDVAGVGTALLVLALVGLVTGGGGLLLERLVKRRNP